MMKLLFTKLIYALIALCFCLSSFAQDTVWVDATKVNTKYLKEGNNRYLVYFKMGKDAARSRPQFWTRNISFENYNGKEAIVVKQEWEDRDSVIHT
ncbi:MAG TPA: hypothetical protein VGE24_04590, partial [Emticicia sp.]